MLGIVQAIMILMVLVLIHSEEHGTLAFSKAFWVSLVCLAIAGLIEYFKAIK